MESMSKKNARRGHNIQRRSFLGGSAFLAGGYFVANSSARPLWAKSPNDRPRVGAIGLRYQGTVIANQSKFYGDIVAVCDVDKHVREQAKASFGSTPFACEDYRELLARKDVDVVTIGTPDHWHTKMVIDACKAGKDVYCEKPLTLTVDEGKKLCEVVKQTKRVVQVGSWQRSDERFRLAAELVRAGRIGKVKTIEVVLGKNATGGPFPSVPVPKHIQWDLWQGQTPDVPYVEERSHYTFRWWWEYSGGQMTDWGAHHIDIAQWAIGSFPVKFEGKSRMPEVSGGYNVPVDFEAKVTYANGTEMTIRDNGENGILFQGERGRIFVNRGKLTGTPVEELSTWPLPRSKWQLYKYDHPDRPLMSGKLEAIINHMGNFFDCIESRRDPISDVVSQHRSVSTCHLANISLRLGRSIQWDPELEQCVEDAEANAMLKREQRVGYEV